MFGHFFLVQTLCAGGLQFLVFFCGTKAFFLIGASPTSFLRLALRSKIVWRVLHVFPFDDSKESYTVRKISSPDFF